MRMPFFFLLGPALAAWEVSSTVRGAESLPDMDLAVAYPNLEFDRPVCSAVPPDETDRIFVVEQRGQIRILPTDRAGTETGLFFDISDRKPLVSNEEGLLGLDFHPRFRDNGKFYVYYSQQNPRRSIISEFKISADNPEAADMASERILLEVPQPFGNHNSGVTIFGPDGFLYVALGDGGSANDPHGNGQDLTTLLGSVLRIDVDQRTGELAYGIPGDNPFTGRQSGIREEIWAYGFRNPWRMSFDRKTGELWLGDVGQVKWEEVDLVVKGGNYGWNAREGFHTFNESAGIAVNHIAPVIEYPHVAQLAEEQLIDHGIGLSITGGFVYRGKKFPDLEGVYLYADYIIGTVWGLRYQAGKITHHDVLVEAPLEPRVDKKPVVRAIAGFGEDPDGEILVLAFDGRIYELISRQ